MRTLIVLVALLIGCEFTAGVKPERPPCATQDPVQLATDWNGFHLPEGSRFPRLVDKTGGLYDVAAMAAAWNALGAPVGFGDDDFVVEVTVGEPEGALGLAEAILDGEHIVGGRITMNPKAIARAGLNATAGAHILCQEMGHFPFGLGHERGMVDTCLNDCVGLGSRKAWIDCLQAPEAATPNSADRDMLIEKYAHTDGKGKKPRPDMRCRGRVEVHRVVAYGADNGH